MNFRGGSVLKILTILDGVSRPDVWTERSIDTILGKGVLLRM